LGIKITLLDFMRVLDYKKWGKGEKLSKSGQRDMGKRLFCLYGRDKRKDNQRIRKNAREGRYRTSGA